MSVIPLTVFFSLGLVFFFLVLFLREHRHRLFASAERDSLLPLADESPRIEATAPGAGHAHDHAEAGCGCRRGEHPPCLGCRHEAAAQPLR